MPEWFHQTWLRLKAFLRRRQLDRDLELELQFHLSMREEKRQSEGLAAAEARTQARREFGNANSVKETCRELWTFTWLETLWQDLRYGVRTLRRGPAFTAVAVLSLALGIGANTAIFTLINAVMLKTLPVRNPENLLMLNWVAHDNRPLPMLHWLDGSRRSESDLQTSPNFSYRSFDQIRSRSQAFSDIFAFKGLGRLNVMVNGQAGLAEGQLVSGNYFSGLGLPAIVGRTITDNDDKPGAPPVAVISYGYWKRSFGGDPGAVGKALTLNSVPFILIGVTPPEFFGLTVGTSVDVSIPLMTQPFVEPRWVEPGVSLFTATDHWWLDVMGRLKPGVTVQEARTGLDVIFYQSVTEGVSFKPGEKPNIPWLRMTPGGKGLDDLRREFSQPLFILMTVVGLVLLIACANVANLLLSRATARQREMAVRLALGAKRTRLIRQLLTESVTLAVSGGLLGLIFAYWGSHLLLALISHGDNPIALDVHPDFRVLSFTALACLATGVLFGLVPALRSTRVDLTPSLKASAGTLGSSGLRLGLAKILVVSQVVLSLVLLVGAGLFVRTLVNLETLTVGFNRDNVLLFGIDPPQRGYKGTRLADFYDQLQARIGALPGVQSATLSLHRLLSGSSRVSDIWVQGYTPKPNENLDVYELPVGTNFFETMQIPLLLGRTFRAQDNEHAPKVAIVNETLARHFFGKENPIGRQFSWGGPDSTARVEIVGLVADAKYTSVRGETPATVYHPFRQTLNTIGSMNFEVRTATDPRAMILAVRRAVQDLDKDLPLYDVKTQNEQVDELLLQERMFAKLSSFFGLLALLLACVGIYGMLSYTVVRRTGEIGIRMALGAHRGDILSMVLRETLLLVSIGTAIGVPLAWAVARLASNQISGLLFGLKATDHVTILVSTLVMAGVALFAGFLPALKASRVDPTVALRYE